jgi:hypothetical protein
MHLGRENPAYRAYDGRSGWRAQWGDPVKRLAQNPYEYLSVAIADGSASTVVPGWCARILDDVAGGRRPLRAVVHPLGFTCLPVVREGDDGVCVHVWPAGQPLARLTTSPVHAHSWDLVSYVLFGRLRNRLFRLSDAVVADPQAWRVLEVHSRGDTDEMVATARLVRADQEDSELTTRENVYTVFAGTFHSSVAPRAEFTVTVALGRTVPGTADMSLADPATRTHEVRRIRLGEEDTRALARAVIEHVTW